MATIRKKIKSISQGTKISVNTALGADATRDSYDIDVHPSEADIIRLIRPRTDMMVESLNDLAADLLFNDEQINAEASKVSALLSDGYFKGIEKDLDIEILETEEFNDVTYIDKFYLKDGQIKYNNQIFLKKTPEVVFTGNTIKDSAIVTLDTGVNINQFSEKMLVFGLGIQDRSFIESINTTTNQLTLNRPCTNTKTSVSLTAKDELIFDINDNIEPIVSSGTGVVYPRFRRDLIEIKDNELKIVKGIEGSVRPASNSQLDSSWQILSIVHDTSDTFIVNLKTGIRAFSELQLNSNIKLEKTINGEFDGEWNIIEKSINLPYWIKVKIPNKIDNSTDQTESGGFITVNAYGLWSILVFKNSESDPTLILDEIEKVAPPVGLSSILTQITRAQIAADFEGLFSASTRERKHLVDEEGRLLDWEHGQSQNTPPASGFNFNQTDIIEFTETQLPQEFDDVDVITNESTSLVNLPFKIPTIQNNIFNVNKVYIDSVMLGIKNSPHSIGDEGVSVKIVKMEEAFAADDIHTASDSFDELKNDSTLVKVIQQTGFDFSTYTYEASPGIFYTIEPGDIFLVSNGIGQFQTGVVYSVNQDFLEVTGLTKPLSTSETNEEDKSEFRVFKKSTIADIPNSLQSLSSASLKSQILSGVNGKFGPGSIYSKAKISFNDLSEVKLDEWYILQIKGKNEGITWGRLPFVVVESPDGELSDKKNGFVEVYYRTIAGLYPSGAFFVEDEFGDISEYNADRTKAPHFRPAQYKVIATALDYSGKFPASIPSQLDEVFADVHTGRVAFHPDSKPRKVYFSYFKFDEISGDATSATLKHIEGDSFSKVNIQDKITEIDERFTKGTQFHKPSLTNGIISQTENGYKGSIKLKKNSNLEIEYKESESFNNHFVDKNNFSAKLSKHYIDDIIAVRENSLLLKRPLNIPTEATEGVLLEANSGVKPVTKPIFPGLNKNDERQLPVSADLNAAVVFKNKKFNKALDSLHLPFFNESGVSTLWNDVGIYNYNDYFQVMKTLIRKTGLVNYTAEKDITDKYNQQEKFAVLGESLEQQENTSSVAVANLFATDQKDNQNGIHYLGENFVFTSTENRKTKHLEFLSVQSSNFSAIPDSVFVYDSTVVGDYLAVGYYKTSADNLIKIFPVTKTDDGRISNISSSAEASTIQLKTLPGDLIYKIKLAMISEDIFAVTYIYFDSLVFTTKCETVLLKITENVLSILQLNGADAIQEISADVSTQYLFNTQAISDSALCVAWKTTSGSTQFRILNIDTEVASLNITDEVSITSESVYENPKILRFSKEAFLIIYSFEGKLQASMYNLSGELQFFDEAKTQEVIEFSQSVLSGTGFYFDVVELSNNNICIVYTEFNSSGTFDVYLRVFNEYEKTLESPKKILAAVQIGNRPKEFNIHALNTDEFVLSYNVPGVDDKIITRVFRNNLIEDFNSQTITAASADYSFLKIAGSTEHSFIKTYISSGQFMVDCFDYVIDFTNPKKIFNYIPSADVGALEILNGNISAISIQQHSAAEFFVTYLNNTTNTIEIQAVMEFEKAFARNSVFNGGLPFVVGAENLNIKRISTRKINLGVQELLFVVWTESSGTATAVKARLFDVSNNQISQIDEEIILYSAGVDAIFAETELKLVKLDPLGEVAEPCDFTLNCKLAVVFTIKNGTYNSITSRKISFASIDSTSAPVFNTATIITNPSSGYEELQLSEAIEDGTKIISGLVPTQIYDLKYKYDGGAETTTPITVTDAGGGNVTVNSLLSDINSAQAVFVASLNADKDAIKFTSVATGDTSSLEIIKTSELLIAITDPILDLENTYVVHGNNSTFFEIQGNVTASDNALSEVLEFENKNKFLLAYTDKKATSQECHLRVINQTDEIIDDINSILIRSGLTKTDLIKIYPAAGALNGNILNVALAVREKGANNRVNVGCITLNLSTNEILLGGLSTTSYTTNWGAVTFTNKSEKANIFYNGFKNNFSVFIEEDNGTDSIAAIRCAVWNIPFGAAPTVEPTVGTEAGAKVIHTEASAVVLLGPDRTKVFQYSGNQFLTVFQRTNSVVIKNTEVMPFAMKLNTDKPFYTEVSIYGNPQVSYSLKTFVTGDLKIKGLTYDNKVLPTFSFFKSDNDNVSVEQIIHHDIYSSEIQKSAINILKLVENQFILIFQPFDKQSTNKIYLQKFIIERNAFFKDSDLLEASWLDFSSYGLDETGIVADGCEDGIFIAYKSLEDNKLKYVIVSDDLVIQSVQENDILFNGDSNDGNKIIIGIGKLIENYKLVLIFDKVTKKFFTNIFCNEGNELKKGTGFPITSFDLTTDEVSLPVIDSFGYINFTFIDSATKQFKFLQRGIDGSNLGVCQVVGKNKFDGAQSTVDGNNGFDLITHRQFESLSREKGFAGIIYKTPSPLTTDGIIDLSTGGIITVEVDNATAAVSNLTFTGGDRGNFYTVLLKPLGDPAVNTISFAGVSLDDSFVLTNAKWNELKVYVFSDSVILLSKEKNWLGTIVL